MPSQTLYNYHRSNNIIQCAPKIVTCNPFHMQFASIKSLSSMQKSFFHQFYSSINSSDRISNTLSSKIQSNIAIDEDELRESEIKSITSGFGQFIADAFFECVTLYNYSTDNFIEKSKIFSAIPTDSEPYKLIRAYLKNYLRYIAKPIKELEQIVENNHNDIDIDDDEYDTIDTRNTITYKHNMRRMLHYISKYKFALPSAPRGAINKSCQIDAIHIPKSDAINGELLRSNGIEYDEITQFSQWELNRKIANLSRLDTFSRFIILVIGGDNISIGSEKIYLIKMATDNELTSFLNDTELVWTYNTRNNPEWLNDIVQQYNGLTFSYHMHSNDIQRVYLSYKSIENIYYSSRVFKHNIIDILKVFCNEIDGNTIEFDKTEFKDIEYIQFVNRYFSDLKLMQYDNYYRMNELIKEYYTKMGFTYDNNFINYMNENGFNCDEQLDDILGKDIIDYNDCTIVEFDKQFPIKQTTFPTNTGGRNGEHNRFEIIFHILQYCYLNNMVPTQTQIMNKYYNNGVYEFIPGGYCYRGQQGEGVVPIMVFAGTKSSNTTNTNANNGSQNNEQNNNDSNEGDYGGGGGNFNGGYNGNDEDKNNDKDDQRKESKDNKTIETNKQKDPKTLYSIPRKFTNVIIPKMVREKIKDFYHFMIDELRLLFMNNGIYELSNGDRVINFGFHCKYNGEILYVYANCLKENNRGFKWKFENKLYTKNEMQKIKGVSAVDLPGALKLKHSNAMNLNKEMIKTRINGTKWAKINVYNINNKESNKCKLTLAMTVDEFKKNINKYNDLSNIDCNKLIPIVSFDDEYNNYWLEYVYIIKIQSNVEVGIAFKCDSNGKVTIRGIYLDKQLLLRQHMLAAQHHKCDCLHNKLISNITCLEIGNVNTKENKIKDYKRRYDLLEEKYNELLNVSSNTQLSDHKALSFHTTKLEPRIPTDGNDSFTPVNTNGALQPLMDLTITQSISAPTPMMANISNMSSQTSSCSNGSSSSGTSSIQFPVTQTLQYPQQMQSNIPMFTVTPGFNINNLITPGFIFSLPNIPIPVPLLYNPSIPIINQQNMYSLSNNMYGVPPPPPETFAIK